MARVSRMSIDESNRLTKMIPDKPILQMEDAEEPFNEGDALEEGQKLVTKEVEVDDPDNPGQKIKVKKQFKKYKKEVSYKPKLKNCYKLIPELKEELANGTEEVKDVLYYAGKLEGSIRQTGDLGPVYEHGQLPCGRLCRRPCQGRGYLLRSLRHGFRLLCG